MKKSLLLLAGPVLAGSLVAFLVLQTESALPVRRPDSPLPYKFSAVIKEECAKNTPGANQVAAWDYSFIGDYPAALRAWDEQPGPPRRLAAADSLAFVGLHAVEAAGYILARARTERIIILNEAHHNPRHRVFASSLLPGLARLGFRYLAVEAIAEQQDARLNHRGYPVRETGFYTKEPQFGRLLRIAHARGYQLVAYDYGAEPSPDMHASIAAREPAQARNIARLLQTDPQAKILVHCGFSHANEGPDGLGGLPAMAARLRELTGIDPFTIDQTALTEAGTPAGEAACYRLATATRSAVFLPVPGKAPYAHADPAMSVDVNVYHPRTKYQAGRPAWVFHAGYEPVAIVEPITVGYPCLLLAYAAAEDLAHAIPLDVVEVQGPGDKKCFALPKGSFTVLAMGRDGRRQTWVIQN
ncbi:hypothetical protein [Hymenobacter lapidiphilus]|uniref:Erythromycin esterase family protein n=1 Tax=Hymenobacter lapidiphilus TaxID=2608003 RepID=A0A7Y7PR50_9BACT|nr:hypothetical protein [Hymenobacter lapidiphilus]NVO32314.1 hypothetical protein [Hymenobacter lapidiphilus]